MFYAYFDCVQLKLVVENVRERAAHLFDDTAPEYCDVSAIIRRFMDWKETDERSFREAYADEFITKLLGPFVRRDLLDWNPLAPQARDLSTMHWYQAVLRLGLNNEGFDPNDPVIINLIPDLIEKHVVPKITSMFFAFVCWPQLPSSLQNLSSSNGILCRVFRREDSPILSIILFNTIQS